jgi:monovalent cation/hydrogen antiporter
MMVMVRSILSSRLERFSGLQDGRIFGYRARGQLGLISTLRLKSEDEADKVEELETRLEGAHAAVKRLEQLDDEQVPTSAQERTREQYEERIRRYEAGIEAGGTTEEYAQSSAAWRAWRRELIKVEREAVLSKRDRGEVSPEVMRRVMRDLDLEESRLEG